MKKYLLLAAIFFSQSAMASTVSVTKITSVLMGEVYGNVAFIGISVKPGTVPACQTSTDYSYILDVSTPTGKATLSLILTAYAGKTDVYLNGYDNCSLGPTTNVEKLRQVWIK